METVDLLIIGSGPAGVSTALHLLQQDPGWAKRLVVIEKARHPRQKLCGGAVTRLGMEVMSGLGIPQPLPLPIAWVEEVRFIYRGRTIHVRGQLQLHIFHRAELDAYLAQQACRRGVDLRQDEDVKSLIFDDSGVSVETSRGTFRAQAVVGADGSKGISQRYVPGARRQARVARLLDSLAPAALDSPLFGAHYAVFNFTPAEENLQGYIWDFPTFVGGWPHDNRGVYDARLNAGSRRATLPAILETWLSAHGLPEEQGGFAGHPHHGHPLHGHPLHGHPLHWFSPGGPYARPRLLLAGDAAGADPLFGEGIAPALAYGQLAAQAVRDAFARDDFSFRDYRRRILSSKLGQYLLVRWSIAQVIYRLSHHRWFMELTWTIGLLANRAFEPQPTLRQAEPGEGINEPAGLEGYRE